MITKPMGAARRIPKVNFTRPRICTACLKRRKAGGRGEAAAHWGNASLNTSCRFQGQGNIDVGDGPLWLPEP